MIEKTIKLEGIEDAKRLVGITMKCDFPVELINDSITVDAKSIIGIFSLDFGMPITLRMHCDEKNPMVSEFSGFFAYTDRLENTAENKAFLAWILP